MASQHGDALLTQAWAALATDRDADAVPVPADLDVHGAGGLLSSRLPVEDTATACIATALLAAAALSAQRTGQPPRPVRLARGHVAAAVRSETYLRCAGEPLADPFAPLSRFWRAADGWVRTHGNYSWHKEALLRALGTVDDVGAVGAAISEVSALELETGVTEAGGVAVAVRTADQWHAHPQGQAVSGRRLIEGGAVGEAPPRRRDAGALPAAGVRVVDLTRVIAGPVGTRFLAALGADVLRIDPPHRPELPLHAYDGLLGKRSALLDVRTPEGTAALHALLDEADVLVHGYRPGALDRFGLAPRDIAERHPGLVVVSLSAWGRTGPWSHRRGFDSMVQAASGIAMVESSNGEHPGALPCQLLDHGTGYLCAASALDGLRRQAEHGGTHVRELSLARTAQWLLDQPRTGLVPPPADVDADTWLTTVSSDQGAITTVAPPGDLGGRRLRWPRPLASYGGDPPAW